MFRPGLVRRLVRLERRLRVPEEERCLCEGELRKADVVFVNAVRVWNRADSLKLDANGRVVKGKENKDENMHAYFSPVAERSVPDVDGREAPLVAKENQPEVSCFYRLPLSPLQSPLSSRKSIPQFGNGRGSQYGWEKTVKK